MSLFKAAQEQPRARRAKPTMEAYPDYTKSLVSQRRRKPLTAGLQRAGQSGLSGAVLGAVIARMISDRPAAVAGGAVAGGAVAAVPGFISGKREAESDYSKLLFLRRRAGINEPGELDALLRHPELLQAISQPKAASVKTAGIGNLLAMLKQPGVARAVLGGTVGGIAGAGWGYGVSPHMSGYADVEGAKRLSGFMGATTGAVLGAMAGGRPQPLKQFLTGGKNLRTAFVLPGSIAAGELVPSGVAALTRQSKATQDLANAQADSAIPAALKRVLTSGAGRGAVAGAGVAGLGALITGLSRAKTDDEIRKGRGRAGMVTADFLKYLIPAMAGGGVLGSTSGK